MNNSDTRALSDDLFADPGKEQFQASAMTSMLGAVRRKRRIKQVQMYSALVLILAAASLTWMLNRPFPPVPPHITSRPTGYKWVSTEAFAAERMVQTQAGLYSTTRSQLEGVALIESSDSRGFVRQLDDEGLLGLFAGRAVALVYCGPNEAVLVFPDASGAKFLQ